METQTQTEKFIVENQEKLAIKFSIYEYQNLIM